MRGMLMADFNRTAEALASYEQAVALKPDYSKARWGSCMAALPILYAEESEIAAQRAEYERRLRALRAAYEAGHIPGDMSKGLGMAQPFFLAYQGHNDRDLQRLFGALATRIMADRYGAAELAPPPAPGEPIRVGIVSGFFCQHSVWKVGVRGWVTRARPQALPGVRLSHRLQAGCRDRARQGSMPPVRAGAALDRALAADHPRRPAARAASIRKSA